MKEISVGFVGLGLMGLPMARNILKKGFELTVYNRTSSKARDLVKKGARLVNSPKEVAQNSDVIVICVTGPKDVEEVVLGKDSIKDGASKGSIVVDMSTIGPQAARDIHSKLSKYGIDFIDAPVTGGTMGAENGTLTIFVGGERSVFKKVKPVLESMGTNIQYMGDTGMGQAMKLVNNLLVGCTLASLAESLILAEAQGLSKKQVADILKDVPAVAPFMKIRLPNMVKGEFPTSFSVNNISKDLDLAVSEIKKADKTLPILELSDKLYKEAKEKGFGEEDNSAIFKVLNSK